MPVSISAEENNISVTPFQIALNYNKLENFLIQNGEYVSKFDTYAIIEKINDNSDVYFSFDHAKKDIGLLYTLEYGICTYQSTVILHEDSAPTGLIRAIPVVGNEQSLGGEFSSSTHRFYKTYSYNVPQSSEQKSIDMFEEGLLYIDKYLKIYETGVTLSDFGIAYGSDNQSIPTPPPAPTSTPTLSDNITVILNNSPITFDVPPQVINERTMVPLRAIFEALGASVDWKQETNTVTSTKGNTTIQLTIGSDTMYVNGKAVILDSPACVINNRTLVPVRAISEAYNAKVDWNGDTKTVTISSNTSAEAPPTSTQELTQNDISLTLKIPTNGSYNWYAEIDVQNNSNAAITFPSIAELNGTLVQSAMGRGNAEDVTVEAGKRKKLTYYTFSGKKDMYLDNNSI